MRARVRVWPCTEYYDAYSDASVNDTDQVLQMLLDHECDPTLLTFNKLRPSQSARKMGNIRAAVVLEQGEANWIASGKARRRRSFMKKCFCSYCSVLQKKGPDGTVHGVGLSAVATRNPQPATRNDEPSNLILSPKHSLRLCSSRTEHPGSS